MSEFELGFLALIILTGLVFAASLVFVSIEGKQKTLDHASSPRRERYISVHNVDTNTIETVDAAGVTRRWNSTTGK
jgi:hypothetical protein